MRLAVPQSGHNPHPAASDGRPPAQRKRDTAAP